jgi:hypothetical protein
MAVSPLAVVVIVMLFAMGLFLLLDPFLVASDNTLDLDEDRAAAMLFTGSALLALALGVALW